MATEIKYNGEVIASITRGQTATMECEHKLMTGNIVVEDGTGVHVGSDTPPESVNVWINPNGKPTSVENWDFDMDDGSTETKSVVVIGSDDAMDSDRAAIMKLRRADGTWIEIPALVGDKGDKGDRGDTGVYIGTGTPPASANVWINPNGIPSGTEDWEFELEDETVQTKTVVVIGADNANGQLALLRLKQDDGSWIEIPAIRGSDGVNIVKVEQTAASSEDNGSNVLTITLSNGEQSTFIVKNGSKGEKGDTGAPLTVSKVSESYADGGLNSVKFSDGTVLNIWNGKKGNPGTSVSISNIFESELDGGANIVAFSNGETLEVKNGRRGTPGAKGNDGIPCTHSWDGTVLTVTSASGTSSANLMGESGVTAPSSGFFALSVDGNGDLYVHTPDGGTAPRFEYDEVTGDLYYVTEEE